MNIKEIVRRIVVFLLTKEAQMVLRRYRPTIVAVTGSVGKTSTKDAVYAALKHRTFVRKSEKSFNSDIGVPLTILGLPNGWGSAVQWLRNCIDGALLTMIVTPYPRLLIVELGADRPGDISRLLQWIKPDVVVATTFPPLSVHVEFYDSPEEVQKEEMSPFFALKSGGIAVRNFDDPAQAALSLREGVRTVTYGCTKGADIRATRFRMTKSKGLPSGISFVVTHQEEQISITVPGVVGRSHMYAILAAIACAIAAGSSFGELKDIGTLYEPPPGRLRLVPGKNESMLVDDSYNASPAAVLEACNALENATNTGRRIAVLGDMLELGKYSKGEHTRVGEVALGKVDVLVSVGVRARGFVEGALAAHFTGPTHMFEKSEQATQFLLSEIKKGDVVLIKGSQSMRMERITKALMLQPEDAATLLPRQDEEWLLR